MDPVHLSFLELELSTMTKAAIQGCCEVTVNEPFFRRLIFFLKLPFLGLPERQMQISQFQDQLVLNQNPGHIHHSHAPVNLAELVK